MWFLVSTVLLILIDGRTWEVGYRWRPESLELSELEAETVVSYLTGAGTN